MSEPVAIVNDDHWHALRSETIGGSEVGALFNLSPFMTHWTLWHLKKGLIPPDKTENDKMRWGKRLEPLIAEEIGLKLNWNLRPARRYYHHPTVAGMGCTCDFDILDHQDGPGIVETKAVFEYADYKQDWSDERSPPAYELQVQQQLACTGLGWCATVVWVAQTATLMPALIRRRNDTVIAEIERRVTAFWDSIARNEPPPASGTQDEFDAMKHLWPYRAPRKEVVSEDPHMAEAAQLLRWAGEQRGIANKEYESRRAQLLGCAKDAEVLRVPGYTVYIKQDRRGAIRMDCREDGAAQ